jgi:gliding motility associated protien GldN
MKRMFVRMTFLCALVVSGGTIVAQDLMKEVYVKEHIPNKKPVPYVDTREADVWWSKTVWRMIDLREKANLPLYYPTYAIGERMNLIDLLLLGIDQAGLIAYDPDADPNGKNEFKTPLTKEKLEINLGAGERIVKVFDDQGNSKDSTVKSGRRQSEVRQILVKERWFFDRNYSTVSVRIVGICPIRVYNQEDKDGNKTDQILRKQTFWIYFPQVRPLLASHEVFNRFNDSQNFSFDDFFMQRRFSSYIVAESNEYDNRQISEYLSGIHMLYESDKIKQSIFNFEQDLWEY